MRIKVNGQECSNLFLEEVLIDTNIWVFANNEGSNNFHKARIITIAAMLGEIKTCVSYQNILEFWSAMTNPKVIFPKPNLEIIKVICEEIWKSQSIRNIYPNKDAAIKSVEICQKKVFTRTHIYDVNLALTAHANNVSKIWTDNIKDFMRLDFIEVENPLKWKWEIEGKLED